LVIHVTHPLVVHKLGLLRDERTGSKDFRELAAELSTLLAYEATRNLELQDIPITTPVARMVGQELAGKKLVLVAVLRAGLIMTEAIAKLVPNARVGHIGIQRNHETLEPMQYYCKLPTNIENSRVLLCDPMLATGGSINESLRILTQAKVGPITLVSIIAAPEGIQRVLAAYPEVDLVVAGIDDHLNEHGYIVPGLGDAGDRLFGTL